MPIVLLNESSSRIYEVVAQTVITKVRRLTQDESQPYRNADDEILGWINDCIKTVVSLIPQLFLVTGSHVCSSGFRQVLANARAHSFADVVGVPIADLATLTQYAPGWQTAATGTIQNWMRPANEPLSFYCYPPSAEGQSLTISFVEVPFDLTSVDDQIPLPESYEPAVTGYCVSMVEAKDDESVDSNRSQQFMAEFIGRIKGG